MYKTNRKEEEIEAVLMSCWTLSVGGWVGGLYLAVELSFFVLVVGLHTKHGLGENPTLGGFLHLGGWVGRWVVE